MSACNTIEDCSEKIEQLEKKISELNGLDIKVNANVNLMDDLMSNVGNTLEHTNSVLTLYVGWATITIATVSVILGYVLNRRNNLRGQEILKDYLKEDKENQVTDHMKNLIKIYCKSEEVREELKEVVSELRNDTIAEIPDNISEK